MKPLITLALSLLPALVSAQEYTTLVNIPGVSTGNGFDNFINTLYALSIGIAALLAVIKIVIAGVKYMLTDIVTSKESAKKDIKGALLGLTIVLAAVLILTLINPQLVNVNFDPEPVETVIPANPISPSTESATVGLGETKLPLSTAMLPPDYPVDETTLETVCTNVVPELCAADLPNNVACVEGTWSPTNNPNQGECIVPSSDRGGSYYGFDRGGNEGGGGGGSNGGGGGSNGGGGGVPSGWADSWDGELLAGGSRKSEPDVINGGLVTISDGPIIDMPEPARDLTTTIFDFSGSNRSENELIYECEEMDISYQTPVGNPFVSQTSTGYGYTPTDIRFGKGTWNEEHQSCVVIDDNLSVGPASGPETPFNERQGEFDVFNCDHPLSIPSLVVEAGLDPVECESEFNLQYYSDADQELPVVVEGENWVLTEAERIQVCEKDMRIDGGVTLGFIPNKEDLPDTIRAVWFREGEWNEDTSTCSLDNAPPAELCEYCPAVWGG